MKISDVVKFRSDLFFEGAVQLLWADQNADRANAAARGFVFHGPRYHGVGRDTGTDEAYRLTDTATLAADLLGRIEGVADQSDRENPFSLAIAGYGSGKSHFGVTLTQLLREPHSSLGEQIVANLALADEGAARRVKLALSQTEKPAFVIALDGTGNFNLGNALSGAVFRTLRERGIDDTPLRELSPRFEDAANFVKRNFTVRTSEFSAKFGSLLQDSIVSALADRDEQTFDLVDEIYLQANGAHIPIEGRESAQDLISIFCSFYCNEDGPFSRLVILFDEFGRFLEYVAERPALAGDSALQQIFQGIQDNAGRAHFIGFIQYELKAYLARLGSRDAMHIQKYITRFDVSRKYYLSSNLETIIAHLLEKPEISVLDSAFAQQASHTAGLHGLMAALLPGFKQLPIWNDPVEFARVIVQGCWPLHPLATWFLTRQQDIVQSRSAITFVKNAMSAGAERDTLTNDRLTVITASTIVSGELLHEMLAAERANGGVTVDNLVATLSKYEAQLNDADRALLIAVTAAKKMRVITEARAVYDGLLAEFAGLGSDEFKRSVVRLELELGVLVWSNELHQYEIVSDAASRGQYQKELRNKLASNEHAAKDIFVGRSKAWAEDLLQDIHPSFGQSADISTLEWSFTAQLATDHSVGAVFQSAFADWLQATKPDQPKGQVIYCYVDAETDLADLQNKLDATVNTELKRSGCAAAPIWIILLHDRSKRMAKYLATLYVLEEGFEANERERYARFIPEERDSARQGLQAVLREAIQDRVSIYSGIEVTRGRLTVEASSIFAKVYPLALPFPMDGFSSRTGNGANDAAAIARALFGSDVNGAWLAVQLVRVQNRVRALLGRAWGMLATDGKLKPAADNALIRDVLATLEQGHVDAPKRSLGDDMTMLLRPPYGCNLASASILLGLFVGKALPPRAIYFENEPIARGTWLQSVYGATGRYLDEKGLSNTTVIFLTADAFTRWEMFMQQWDAEQTYAGMKSCLCEAEKMRERDPLPDALSVSYGFLRDKAKSAEQELKSHQGVLNECERRIESALRSSNVAEFIAVGDKYLQRQREMSNQSARWTPESFVELSVNLSQIRAVVQESVPPWTLLQSCNSPQLVSDFRVRMERVERTLNALELPALAKRVSLQKSNMIANVDQRYRYRMTLSEAEDLTHAPDPSPGTPIRDVQERIEKADRLLKVLAEASAEMRDESVSSLADSLKKKQAAWRQFRSVARGEYSALLDVKPASWQEVNDLAARLQLSRQQFAYTADEEDIKGCLAACSALGQLFSELDAVSGTPEQVQNTLEAVFAASPYLISEAGDKAVEDDEEEGEEGEEEGEAGLHLAWINQCFRKYVSGRAIAAAARSQGWTRTALAELKGLEKTPSLLTTESLSRYDVLPSFLGLRDHAEVVAQLATLREIRAAFCEKERSHGAMLWIESLQQQTQNVVALPKEKCVELLAHLDRRPPDLSSTESEKVAGIRVVVERRLDELDISDLINRVSAMPESKRKMLIEQLKLLY